MKKLFIVLAVASLGFAACNNSATDDAAKKAADSTHIADSTAAAMKTADSIAAAAKDTMNKMAADTSKMAPAKK